MSTNEESTKSIRASVIGLGIMGGAFARHLAASGVRTCGYDLLSANLEAFNAHRGHTCSAARAMASEAEVVITSLPNSAALETALFGEEGLVAAGRPGLLVVETSAIALGDKERVRGRLRTVGIGMLDAPTSGTGPQATAKVKKTWTSSRSLPDNPNVGCRCSARLFRSLRKWPRRGWAYKIRQPWFQCCDHLRGRRQNETFDNR